MANTLNLLSSMAPRAVLSAAIEGYRKIAPTRIELHSAGGVDIARLIASGARADIVVLARDAIDKLIAEGALPAERCMDVMRSGIAIAVRAGEARPSIADATAVREAVENAVSIGVSTGPSGKYLEALFARWGLLEGLRRRIVVPPPGIPVAQLLAEGQVQLGFQQLSELMNVRGIEVLGPLPVEIQHLTTFTATIARTCSDRAAAGKFLSFLSSSHGLDLIHLHGMLAGR